MTVARRPAPRRPSSTAAPARDNSLDVLRGIAVLGMVLVNLQGSPADAWWPFVHAAWHGLTLADFVFPLFLFAVGLATPLAIDRRGGRPGWPVVARRAALLFLIGMVIGWLLRPSLEFGELRWTGVLQRIAIVYLACAIVARAHRGVGLPLALAVSLLASHAVLLSVAAPGEVAPGLAPGEGMSGWLDRALLPGRLLRGTHDPEGALSTLSAIATGLAGVAASRAAGPAMSPRPLAILALVAIGAGLLAALALPLNKNLWTPGFALVNIGVGLAMWTALRALPSAAFDHRAGRVLTIAGRTALTLFVTHMALIALLIRPLGGGTLWEEAYARLAGAIGPPALASLLFALIAAAICGVVVWALRARGWLLRV